MVLIHALALFASQILHKKKSPRIYTKMHSAGLELTKLSFCFCFLSYFYFPAPGQAVVTGVVPVIAFNFYRA